MKLNPLLCLCLLTCWSIASALINYEKVSFQQRKPPRQEGFVTCVCGFTLVTRKLPIKELEQKFPKLRRHHTCMGNFRQDVCELPNICQFCIFKMTICCRDQEAGGIYKCSHGHIAVKNDDPRDMTMNGRCKRCSDVAPRVRDRLGPGGMGMGARGQIPFLGGDACGCPGGNSRGGMGMDAFGFGMGSGGMGYAPGQQSHPWNIPLMPPSMSQLPSPGMHGFGFPSGSPGGSPMDSPPQEPEDSPPEYHPPQHHGDYPPWSPPGGSPVDDHPPYHHHSGDSSNPMQNLPMDSYSPYGYPSSYGMSQDGYDWLPLASNQRAPAEDYGLYLPVLHLTAGIGGPQKQEDGDAIWDADECVDEDFRDRSRVETEKPAEPMNAPTTEAEEEEEETEEEEEDSTEDGEETEGSEETIAEDDETTEEGEETTEGCVKTTKEDDGEDCEETTSKDADSEDDSGDDSGADSGASASASAAASSSSSGRRKREEVNFAGQWWKAVKSVFGKGKSIEKASKKIECIVPVLNTADVKCKEKGKSLTCKRTCKKGFIGEHGRTLKFYCDKSVNKWNPEPFGECFNWMPNKMGHWMNQSLARWFP